MGGGTSLNAGVDGDAMTLAIIDTACALLRNRYEGLIQGLRSDRARAADPRAQAAEGRVPCARPSLEFDVVALDSHKPRKFSRHLLLQPHVVLPPSALRCTCARRRACTGAPPEPAAAGGGRAACAACMAGAPPADPIRVPLPLAGSAHAGELARRVVDILGHTLDVRKDNGSLGCFVDLCVYSARRPFRLLGNSKRARATAVAPALTPNLALTSPRLHGVLRPPTRRCDAATIATQLHATLIVAPDALAALLRAQAAAPAVLPAPLDFVRRTEPAAPPSAAAAGSARGAALVAAAAAALAPRPSPANAVARGQEARLAAPPGHDGASAGDDAADAPAQPPADRLSAWRAFYIPKTDSPLLDLPPPLSDHPAICATAKGGAAPPAIFRSLEQYAEDHFGPTGGGVRGWSYVRSAHPIERLLHLTAGGRVTCGFIGRPHKSHHVMLTFDLLEERVWQRCWDSECRVPAPNGRGYLKARHGLAGLGCGAWPSWEALHQFEVSAGCVGDRWGDRLVAGALPSAGGRADAPSSTVSSGVHPPEAQSELGGVAVGAPPNLSACGGQDDRRRGERLTCREPELSLGLALLVPQPAGRQPCVEASPTGGPGRAQGAASGHIGHGDGTPLEPLEGLQQAGGRGLLGSAARFTVSASCGHQRAGNPSIALGTARPGVPAVSHHTAAAGSPPGPGTTPQAAPANEWLGVLDYARRFSGEGGLANFEAEHQKRRARLARMLP